MNLADMLTYADIGQLTTIAEHYECECKRNSKHELIQSILVMLGRREFIEQQVSSCSAKDLRFLNTLLFDTRDSYSLEELQALITQTAFEHEEKDKGKTESPREAIARFKRSGWLFNGMTQNTKFLFQMPNDLKDRFRHQLGKNLRDQIILTGEPQVYREEQNLCADDLLLFLRYLKDQDIELNQESVMYRRHQMQIMEMLHVSEPLVSKGGWRFGYGRTFSSYPSRFALLYDFAYYHGYIAEDGLRLRLTAKGSEILDGGMQESMVQIFRFWLRLYKQAVPNLSSLVYWTSECAKEWVTVSSLHEAIGWLIKPYYYDTAESIMNDRILGMMLHLGLVRIGQSPEHGMVMQMTAWGQKVAGKSSVLGGGTLHASIDKT
ncbi:hypothetical protein GRF59_13865 [Paenibacillus sp. HJL G12]|uniref:Helicase XPB/Ssl2 N-terminal domain-containing protein n=1 Tax=Paenibacillus dendrobii TaxID=2691084 RepID=A0A7X3IJW7_9BACL|nr:hypothetical protein [Paenibacillus dendrobii]MWV44701.1 hypothetical protein [Paenibacillus dendrobii]